MSDVSTLVDKIKALSPELTANTTDETLLALLTQVQPIALADGFPEVAYNNAGVPIHALDMATEYLALHLIALNQALGDGKGNVTSEQVAVLKRTYADVSKLKLWQRSPWGQLYLWLYNLYGNGSQTRYGVIQH
ncbi:DUF4054 domain-containing protein [Lactobacillus xujianguonis]|uniref:DUF4054 domain-containing protein n=1 Tax=Lactobacillus xujianguonis TaxID=2495899 RepID=A0A437ST90_9LACO|nr:DUF4054 domain-containing protein [Lactobacillus xujianguonis]RVU70166.1 DUF4054 domain-containing protein [Lactobacillus xujianguonis]RVU73529.1 DUF4054 domain-containing protein [Lactobacillus xujianguonis]